jgi:hypothetical protein
VYSWLIYLLQSKSNKMDNLLQSTILRNGGILGLVSMLTFVGGAVTGLMDFSSVMSSVTFGILSILIIIGMVIYGVSQYRSELNNRLSFNQAFIAAFGISLLGNIIGTAGQYIYTSIIDPSFYDAMAEQLTTMMEKYNTPESAMQQAVEQIRNSGSMEVMAKNLLNLSIFMAIVCLVIAAIMKRKPDNPFDDKIIDQL